mmetsp:Transcript_25717/g.69521  ORF Transcript_25717/g.69521 Transcript_25717/m.69521 type:complete len:339 (-) Transcript_25717:167-1183(-)
MRVPRAHSDDNARGREDGGVEGEQMVLARRLDEELVGDGGHFIPERQQRCKLGEEVQRRLVGEHRLAHPNAQAVHEPSLHGGYLGHCVGVVCPVHHIVCRGEAAELHGVAILRQELAVVVATQHKGHCPHELQTLLAHHSHAQEAIHRVHAREEHVRRQGELLVELDQPIHEDPSHGGVHLALPCHVVGRRLLRLLRKAELAPQCDELGRLARFRQDRGIPIQDFLLAPLLAHGAGVVAPSFGLVSQLHPRQGLRFRQGGSRPAATATCARTTSNMSSTRIRRARRRHTSVRSFHRSVPIPRACLALRGGSSYAVGRSARVRSRRARVGWRGCPQGIR